MLVKDERVYKLLYTTVVVGDLEGMTWGKHQKSLIFSAPRGEHVLQVLRDWVSPSLLFWIYSTSSLADFSLFNNYYVFVSLSVC